MQNRYEGVPMRKLIRTCVALIAALLLTVPAQADGIQDESKDNKTESLGASPNPNSAGARADILYFQDAHEIAPVTWKNGKQMGGIARLATVIRQAQAETGDPIVAFGGDVAGGTLFGGLYKGIPFIEAFNALGVDIASFGQHDFDFGIDHTRSLMKQSDFPWITSNIKNIDGTDFSAGKTSWIEERSGLRIGFLAITGSLANTTAGPDLMQSDYIESARAAVEQLRKDRADSIILMSQASLADTEAVMAAEPDIDIALLEEFSGSSAAELKQLSDGRYIAAAQGDYSAVIQVTAKRTANDGVHVDPKILPVDETVENDPDFLKIQNKYVNEVEQKMAEIIGTAAKSMDRPELGGIIADAFREQLGADAGWLNGGGVRSTLDVGAITLHDAYSVLPFANTPVVIETNGAVLKTALEQGIASSPQGSGGFPRVAGFTFTWDSGAPAGSRVSSVTWNNGKEVSDDDVFSLALTDYVRRGGNGVTAFADARIIKPNTMTDVEAFIAYVRSHKQIPQTGEINPAGPKEDPTTPGVEPVKPTVRGPGFFYVDSWGKPDADRVMNYGDSGDEVFFGDWDGDGIDTPMVRRGNRFLGTNHWSGTAEFELVYGNSADRVLIGDWDGNGRDSIAVVRGNQVLLRNALTSGKAERTIAYGNPSDVLLVGNFDSDSTSELIAVRGNTLYVQRDLSDSTGARVFSYGRDNDRMIVGDWNGDGIDGVGVVRGNEFLLRDDLRSGIAQRTFAYGDAFDSKFVGDWNGDGLDTPAVDRR